MRDPLPNVLEKYRITAGHASTSRGAPYGAFHLPIKKICTPQRSGSAVCIMDDGRGQGPNRTGWEHVSVTHALNKGTITPTWDIMAKVKDLFWKPSECVMQIHPPEEDYIDIHENVLHLWRPLEEEIPRPPDDLV